ncbi:MULTISPECIES: carbohydrate ABC transporter permease [Paenibacillus]|uniref:carbohydrate ABC transporter permease n=1 Tax=Paenibacillus TaxID=44249 RepID=UPI00087E80AC|nr:MULTISPECIES: carbohydrate ABC transporter permease [Paenibacillus]WDQ30681.1 carbohydrate ABC transporter permease [Paenibacillus marchantiae]SDK14842.1 putative aldouronate transport system permease protein [Paenibacillus sp. OK060]SEA48430.1 putative aldouronate transport system permease protein [Paenibacillus sp. 276b]SHN56883.1 putative aldouronate transport system permease protein [Paenibacillus sp. ov031]SLK21630.1 putative aldouronate transport system permease protein [Paenibacillus
MSYSASLKDRMGRFVIYAIVILLALICLLPLWNIVAISFSSSEAVSANAVGLLPVKFTTAAYSKIIEDAQFWRSFGISVLRVALSLILNMILIVLMAYPLSKSKREFKGRNIYMNVMIFAMLFSGGMIPSYLLIKNLDMLNTIWSLVLPGAVPIFSVILVMNFFAAVPKALEEAAFIDGANALQVLFKVYVPVSIPALATVSLFSIVGTWNDFFSGLIYMTKVSNYPLMTYIQSLNVNIAELLQSGTNSAQLSNLTEISNKNLNAAKIVVAVIPLLLIYPLLQKYFVTGIVVGSVKE